MLIDSPRLTRQDRDEWARRARYDRAHAARLGGMPDEARATIEEWAAGRDTVDVAVSWGKDSVTVAHLALTSRCADRVRLIWVRQRWHENPDSLPVRDAFLALHPGARYEERYVTTPYPRRWDPDATPQWKPPSPRPGGVWPEHRVTGIRADESDARRMSANTHGESTTRTCRPILWWRQEHVFGFLTGEDLPIHPAYAMTTVGGCDRSGIRVHSLGGLPGLRHRGPWEDAYYGDVIRAGRVEVAVLRCLPQSKVKRVHSSVLRARVMGAVEGIGPMDVSSAVQRLEQAGLVARLCRQGHESWWRWPDRPVALPGTGVAGDLAG